MRAHTCHCLASKVLIPDMLPGADLFLQIYDFCHSSAELSREIMGMAEGSVSQEIHLLFFAVRPISPIWTEFNLMHRNCSFVAVILQYVKLTSNHIFNTAYESGCI